MSSTVLASLGSPARADQMSRHDWSNGRSRPQKEEIIKIFLKTGKEVLDIGVPAGKQCLFTPVNLGNELLPFFISTRLWSHLATKTNKNLGFTPQSKELTRGPPEIVQHFRLKSTACPKGHDWSNGRSKSRRKK
jgi:hypothetical protein